MTYDLAYQIGSYLATGSTAYDNRELVGNPANENIYASIRSLVNVGTGDQSSAVWCEHCRNIFCVSFYAFFLSFFVLFLFEKKKLSSFKSISWSKDVTFSRLWIACVVRYGHTNGHEQGYEHANICHNNNVNNKDYVWINYNCFLYLYVAGDLTYF